MQKKSRIYAGLICLTMAACAFGKPMITDRSQKPSISIAPVSDGTEAHASIRTHVRSIRDDVRILAPTGIQPKRNAMIAHNEAPPETTAIDSVNTTAAPPAGQTKSTRGTDIAWPEKHAFRSCFRTEFTTQILGRTNGKPSTWVSEYQVLSTSSVDEIYVFCFPEKGVSGSAMYTGGTWIYFRRNDFGKLHGDIKRSDGSVTRFIYFPATTGDDYSAAEGLSTLYVALNAKKPPTGGPNVIVLQGVSKAIPIGQP